MAAVESGINCLGSSLLWYVAIYRKLLIIPFYLPSLPILKAVSKLKVLAWIQFLHHNTLLKNTFYTEAELRKILAENLVYLRKSKADETLSESRSKTSASTGKNNYEL